mgnify:CR=1 FL=1
MEQMEPILRQGLTALGLPAEQIPQLKRYAELLVETNKVMNLTAITEPADIATLHFLDCAALLTLADFRNKTVADVGTGAGFPGLPLKILEPSLSITLLDAQGKRVNFLQQVCDDLGLTGVECVHARAEEFAAGHREGCDIVTSRAVAALPLLCELCLPYVKVGGLFLAMKSVDSGEELNQAGRAIAKLGGRLLPPVDYEIPGCGVRHRVVRVEKLSPTPKGYPRHGGTILKHPL